MIFTGNLRYAATFSNTMNTKNHARNFNNLYLLNLQVLLFQNEQTKNEWKQKQKRPTKL